MIAGPPNDSAGRLAHKPASGFYPGSGPTRDQPRAEAALAEVGPALNKYIASAEAIVPTAQADKAHARTLLPEFLAAFGNLEGRLASVSDRIEASASAADEDAANVIAKSKTLGLVILLVAAIVTLAVAAMIVRGISNGIDQQLATEVSFFSTQGSGSPVAASVVVAPARRPIVARTARTRTAVRPATALRTVAATTRPRLAKASGDDSSWQEF